MKREIREESLSKLEKVVGDSLAHVGLGATCEQTALLLRLIFSGIGSHFFYDPDTKFRIGFIDIEKSPDADELFKVSLVRSAEDKIINADTLYKYYKGELAREEKLKEVLDVFVNELLNYAQAQEISIAALTEKINNKKAQKSNKRK